MAAAAATIESNRCQRGARLLESTRPRAGVGGTAQTATLASVPVIRRTRNALAMRRTRNSVSHATSAQAAFADPFIERTLPA